MGKWNLMYVLVIVMLLVFVGCSSKSSSENVEKNEQHKEKEENNEKSDQIKKKQLKVALPTSPPTLDQPTSTATVTRDVSRAIFETLITTDSNYQVVPMLAESFDVSGDNKTFTFHLRQGVTFHNGKEMTSEDVVASMNRWIEKSTVTGTIFDNATFEAKDDYTVVLELDQPSVLALDTMATAKMAAAIMPKEIVESASAEGVEEYIGTGPYKFVEWKQDQYIHLTKYDEYTPVETEANGLAGKKEALIDDLYFYIVTDASTRWTGLTTGEYDFIYTVPFDSYEQLLNEPNAYPVFDTYGEMLLLYNNDAGLSSNFDIRRAINAALDIDKIMLASFSNEDLYWLHPGYLTKTVSHWTSEAGSGYYNQKDPELAKEILEDIGYNHEEFRILTTRDYPQFYNAAVVIEEQLKEIGLNVKLEVYDWPTLLDIQNKSDDWEASITGSSTVTTPTQLLYIGSSYVHDDMISELLGSISEANSQEEAKELWDELQSYAWEKYLPLTILGGYNNLYGANNKIEGIQTLSGPIYWNVDINE